VTIFVMDREEPRASFHTLVWTAQSMDDRVSIRAGGHRRRGAMDEENHGGFALMDPCRTLWIWPPDMELAEQQPLCGS
jgi:hypothetical protein